MNNFTFLTEEQCFGDEKLEIFEERGTKAAITDFSILLGGNVSNIHIDSDNSLEGRTGFYWTKSNDLYGDARTVYVSGYRDFGSVKKRDGGARPALPFSSISSIPTNGASAKRAADGVYEVEYGYYPQKAVSKEMQEKLEQEFKSGRLSKTGNVYTTDSKKYKDTYGKFEAKRHEEYQYNGKRYVRVKAKREFQLSNGEKYKDGDYVWVEVSPVKWLVDKKAKIMITEKLIFAGVQFNYERNYRTENFDKTDIKFFMDTYLSKELEQSIRTASSDKTEETKKRKTRIQKMNPDKTENNQRVKMTNTEIIHNWIESGESVLLRGPSGIGKTERVKTLYPNLIYMKLTNNMFPEKVVGSTNLQTGQTVPPDFAKTIVMQGATEEEKKQIEESIQNIYDIADKVYERSKETDEKVVILLDELLNVKPAVQSLVYTLVLNRIVEIGKGLKLPKNVVVVGTGNQKKYSMVAEDLAEPLEKRFDHILDMEPEVGEWITEYAIPQKIHPAVLGYILSKYNTSGKSEEIDEIGYFYEEPEVGEEHLDKNGCKGRTNDPRGWTSISNTLYNFERNLQEGKYEGKDVEDIAKRSIESKLRMEWAEEFFDFYNMPTITPEEVVQGMGKGYTEEDLPKDINERFSCMTALITADETQVEACREFIRKYCDPEYLEIYDIYWAGNNERKMEKISELQSLHTGEEAKKYAQNGIVEYSNIGTIYNSYLNKSKENRGEEDARNAI